MAFRGTIPDFALANAAYVGASVAFFTVTPGGTATGTLAQLFADPISEQQIPNPVQLDSLGKFKAPVYIEVPVIAQVTGPNVPSHLTGVINARGTDRGNWTANTVYYSGDFVSDPVSGNLYIVTQDYTSSALISTDITAGNLDTVIDQTAIVSGGAALAIKVPVQVSTTSADGNLALSGLIVVDSYQTKAFDRVLVNNQTNAAQNGIYNAAAGAWTRSSDAFESAMFANGCVVYVINGALNHGKGFQLSLGTPFTLGTSPQNWAALELPYSAIPVTFASAPDTFLLAGAVGYVIAPFNCTIQSVTLLADRQGSVVIDIWKVPYLGFPPTIANSITAADLPTLSNAISMQDATLPGWTKQISQGDVLAFVIVSVSGIKGLSCELAVTRSF